MSLHSKYLGDSLVFWSGHRKRIVDAIGANVVKYSNDFVSLSGVDDWTLTLVDGGTDGAEVFSAGDGSGGFLTVTTNDAENDGYNAQFGGEAFQPKSTNDLYFGAFGVSINDVTQTDLFLGLSVTSTGILGGVNDSLGFRKVDGSAALSYITEQGTTETTGTAATLVDSTDVDLEFYWSGADQTLEFFVNGVSVASPAITNIPNEALKLSIHFLTGEGAAQTLLIDRLTVIQIGR